MSNCEPLVESDSSPSAGAVKRYQIDAPPGSPVTAGSPGCLVAPLLPPSMSPSVPSRTVAEAKASLVSGTKKLAVIVGAQPPFTCIETPDGCREYSVAGGDVVSEKSTCPLEPGNTSAADPW